jgi:hypothetical protein
MENVLINPGNYGLVQSFQVVRLIGLVGPLYTISSIDSIMCPGRLVVRLDVA